MGLSAKRRKGKEKRREGKGKEKEGKGEGKKRERGREKRGKGKGEKRRGRGKEEEEREGKGKTERTGGRLLLSAILILGSSFNWPLMYDMPTLLFLYAMAIVQFVVNISYFTAVLCRS